MISSNKLYLLFIGIFLISPFYSCKSVQPTATTQKLDYEVKKTAVQMKQEQSDASPDGIHPSKSPKSNPNSQSQLQPSGILQDK